MADVTTLPEMYHSMMRGHSLDNIQGTCVICGKRANNRHHIVPRSAGELYLHGRKVKKPTALLCGSGTTGCHGLAHQKRLFFKYVPYQPKKSAEDIQKAIYYGKYNSGHWEYLITDKPTDLLTALDMPGFKKIGEDE